MKILMLNPYIDASHRIVTALEKKGVAILLPANADETLQMLALHGNSVDLAIIHREGTGTFGGADPGLKLIAKIKEDPQQQDLPVILSSEVWGDAEFVAHQQSPHGVNAYLACPFKNEKLVKLIEAVLGQALELDLSAEVPTAPTQEVDSGAILVEEINHTPQEATGEFALPELGFALEAPTVEESSSVETPHSEPSVEMDLDVQDTAKQDASEMPYVFTKSQTQPSPSPIRFEVPVGDSVVPGGASQSPDTETLKKYLLLREQDVAVLSNQNREAAARIQELEGKLKEQNGINVEMNHVNAEQKKKIEDFEREKAVALEGVQAELGEIKFQLKTKNDKARFLESQIHAASEEMEKLKERVRSDIRKIRVREKELENRLEITKKDSEALISSRENKIIELKRKLDLLEFNMDLLQDQYSKEKEISNQLREKLARVAQAMRVAGGLLDTGEQSAQDAETEKRKVS